jgi:WD40 repeat protein
VAFSSDGKTLASGSIDKNVILWDVASRERLGASLSGHDGPVYSVALSPDGKTLASGSGDSSIILWNVNLASWKDRACEMAGRNLTHLEWARYFAEQGAPYHKTCEQWPEEN